MDRLTVVGLDLSLTSTGFCTAVSGLLGGQPETRALRTARKSWERLDHQQDAIWQALAAAQPDLIVVEAPLPKPAKGASAYYHENAGLWWIVTWRIWRKGIPMATIHPAVLKKYATGSGNADKVKMCLAAARRFNLTGDIGPDEADALWLAAAGCQHYGLPLVQVPAEQAAVLEKTNGGIRWPARLGQVMATT